MIPHFCECGCGNPTKPASKTNSSRGWVKGKPIRFLYGHNGRRAVVGYNAAHTRLGLLRGACVDCGNTAKDWSLRKGTPVERLRADISGGRAGRLYSLCSSDYVPRCRRCHLAYDGRKDRKLTSTQAGDILHLALFGAATLKEIGARFGVSDQTVLSIKKRRIWPGIGMVSGGGR